MHLLWSATPGDASCTGIVGYHASLAVGSSRAKGTQVTVGQSKTIDVDLVSSGPTGGDWMVTPVDMSGAAIRLSLDRATGQNGNRVHLTIHAVSRPSNGVALYRLRSTLGTAKTVWWGAVGITP